MNMPNFETLIYAVEQQVAEIHFNRPHRLNAVVEQFYTELLAALSLAERDSAIRAVILTGAGRAFCVGADLKEHGAGQRTAHQRRQYLQLGNDVCEKIFRLSKPVVAAVNGYALGAGAEMAVSCDFVLMAESAQIGFPEVSIGTSVGGGVTQILPRLVGLNKARELLFLGTRIDGAEAQRIGLATQVHPDAELLGRARHDLPSDDQAAHHQPDQDGPPGWSQPSSVHKSPPLHLALLTTLNNQGGWLLRSARSATLGAVRCVSKLRRMRR